MSQSSSGSWRRLLWEIVIGAVLVGVSFAVWRIEEYRWGGKLEAERASHRAAVETATSGSVTAVTTAHFQSFAAGIRPALLSGSHDAVDAAIGELIRVPEILFVHVFAPDGTVLATTDRKLAATGQADSRARWALAAPKLDVRPAADGVWEAAGPIPGTDQPIAILWLGWQPASSADAR